MNPDQIRTELTAYRPRALVVLVVLALSACGVIPDIPAAGTVVEPGPCPVSPCNPRKYLTVRGPEGRLHIFRVRKPVHDACPVGSAWPACKGD